MNVNEFVTKYKVIKNEDTAKEYVEKHIKNVYVPYEKKIDICERIINATSYIEVDGVKIYKKNSPAEFMLFELNIIDLYTDIKVDFNSMLAEFNMLNEFGLIEAIASLIPTREYVEFNTLLDMKKDDTYQNERDLVSWFETKYSALSLAFSGIIEKLDSEDIVNLIKSNS